MFIVRTARKRVRGFQVPQLRQGRDNKVPELQGEVCLVQVQCLQLRGTVMGKVATVFKIYPDAGKENEVVEGLRKSLKPESIQLEDVAFGIKVVKALFIHEDQEGSTEFEERIRKIHGVNEVEVAEETLI